ncbi:MAG: DUF5106 domain-containing protein [Rikenellaceae bacterium]
MIKRLIARLKSATMNEKMMYSLLLLFTVGIIIRWDFISKEVSEAFSDMFAPFDSIAQMSESKRLDFELPAVPSDVTSLEEQQRWMIDNMWRSLDASDTTLIGSQKLSDAFELWSAYLQETTLDSAAMVVNKVYSTLKANEPMHNEFLRLGECYLSDSLWQISCKK